MVIKKLISSLLAFVLILSIVTGAFADTYTISNGTDVIVTGGETQNVQVGTSTAVPDSDPVFTSNDTTVTNVHFFLNTSEGDVNATFKDIKVDNTPTGESSQTAGNQQTGNTETTINGGPVIVIGSIDAQQATADENQQQTEVEQNTDSDSNGAHGAKITLNNVDLTTEDYANIGTIGTIDEVILNVENENNFTATDTSVSFGTTSALFLNVDTQPGSHVAIEGSGAGSTLNVSTNITSDKDYVSTMSIMCDGDIDINNVNLNVTSGGPASEKTDVFSNLLLDSKLGSININNSSVIALNYTAVDDYAGDALTLTSDRITINSSKVVAASNSLKTPSFKVKTIPNLINCYLYDFVWKYENGSYVSVHPDGTYTSLARIFVNQTPPVNPIDVKAYTLDGKEIAVRMEIVGNRLVCTADSDNAIVNLNSSELKKLAPYGVDTVEFRTNLIVTSFSISDVLKASPDGGQIELTLLEDSASMSIGGNDVSHLLTTKVL